MKQKKYHKDILKIKIKQVRKNPLAVAKRARQGTKSPILLSIRISPSAIAPSGVAQRASLRARQRKQKKLKRLKKQKSPLLKRQ